MGVNDYMVNSYQPASGSINVPLNSSIVVKFSEFMDRKTINTDNIKLNVAQSGESVAIDISHEQQEKMMTVKPKTSLSENTTYVLTIKGGPNGIATPLNGYTLAKDKTMSFTTKVEQKAGVLTGLNSETYHGIVTLSWDKVESDSEVTYSIEVRSEDVIVWPEATGDGQTKHTEFMIPKKFEPGAYTASVRANSGSTESISASSEFVIAEEQKDDEDTPKDDSIDAPIQDIFSFGVEDVYPRDGAVHITPESVVILFDDDVDESTVTNETVYVVNGKNKANIGILDLMTKYNHSKSVGNMTLETQDNFIKISGSFLPNAEYTVIVKGEVKSKSGNALGRTYSMSFLTEFPRLYGDAELIRSDIGGFVSGISDRILYKIMRDNSEYAYDVASQSGAMAANTANSAPLFVHQYVRYKTAYDLMVNAQIKETSSTGSKISLGDLSVDKDNSTSNTQSLMRDFKDLIKVWEDALRGQSNRGYAQTRSVVKGENTTYPAFLTRAEYRELGE